MAVEKIEAFKTTDGKVFTAKHEANKHQEGIYIREKITEIVEKECYRGMGTEEIVKFIMENKDDLFTALSTRIY